MWWTIELINTFYTKQCRFFVNLSTNTHKHKQSTKSSIFQIVHWNCRSLYNKKAKILQYLETYKPNILILNEINCQEHIINFISHNTSYQIEAKCRKNKRGGGVCIFIKSNIEYRIIKTPNDLESIGIQIEIKNEKLNIYGYYNPPNRNIDLDFIRAITTGPNKFIIAGDLNARTSLCKANKTNKNGRDLDNIQIEQNCFMLNDTNQDTYVRYNKFIFYFL